MLAACYLQNAMNRLTLASDFEIKIASLPGDHRARADHGDGLSF